MPIPFAIETDRQRVADALEEMAKLVLRIAADPHAPAPRASLSAIAGRFERVDKLLEAGVAGGGVRPAQIRSIATQFEAVARELRKGEGRRPAARTARPSSRASAQKPSRRPTRRKK